MFAARRRTQLHEERRRRRRRALRRRPAAAAANTATVGAVSSPEELTDAHLVRVDRCAVAHAHEAEECEELRTAAVPPQLVQHQP